MSAPDIAANKLWLSRAEAASVMSVSIATFDRLRQTERDFPPAKRLGKRLLKWRTQDVQDYMAAKPATS